MGATLSLVKTRRRKQHRIEQWRAHSTDRGVFAVALTAGDGARHHRNWWDFLSARHVLIINQVITLCFAIALSGLSLFISIQLNKDEIVEDEGGKSDETLGVEFSVMTALGLLIATSMAQGITATVNLHLGHLGIFLFLVLFIIPALILFALVMTDLQVVLKSFIKHRWPSKSLLFLRREACNRSPRKRCAVPRVPTNYNTISEMCLDRFNEDDCAQLRNKGIKKAWDLVRSTAAFLAVIAWTESAMLLWCVRLVCIIVTVPIVMQSAMRFYIYVLVPIGVSVTFVGLQFNNHEAVKLEGNVDYIGDLFVSVGVIMFVAVLVGRFSSHVRSARGMITFIIMVVTIIVLCAVIASYAISLFFQIPPRLRQHNRDDLDELACKIDLYGCERCGKGEEPERCREWKTPEIIRYVQAYVKFSGFLALVSIPPWIVFLYVGYSLYMNYRDYQSAYI